MSKIRFIYPVFFITACNASFSGGAKPKPSKAEAVSTTALGDEHLASSNTDKEDVQFQFLKLCSNSVATAAQTTANTVQEVEVKFYDRKNPNAAPMILSSPQMSQDVKRGILAIKQAPKGNFDIFVCDKKLSANCNKESWKNRLGIYKMFGILNPTPGVLAFMKNVEIQNGIQLNRKTNNVLNYDSRINEKLGITPEMHAAFKDDMLGGDNQLFDTMIEKIFPGRQYTESGNLDANDPCDGAASPLILDFSQKGIVLSSQAEGVYFDINADGKKERISWPINRSYKFLTLDLNNDGTINNGSELFGNYSLDSNGKLSANGFLALGKYDDNQDGRIDENDAVYKRLRLWEDVSHDGLSQTNELSDLLENSVRSIDLQYVDISEIDQWGNETRQRSAFQTFDGGFLLIFDVWFRL